MVEFIQKTLRWSPTLDTVGHAGYRIYVALEGDGVNFSSPYIEVDKDTTSISVPSVFRDIVNIEAGVRYEMGITAFDDEGRDSPSMDIVVGEFEELMACEILIKAFYTGGSYKRGYPIAVKDVPCVWGPKEGLPKFVVLRITDTSKAHVRHYVSEQWKKEFDYSIVNENVLGYRIRIEVNPALVSASGLNKEVKLEVKLFIHTAFGGVLVEHGDDYAIFDVPKPIDLPQAKAELNDGFASIFDIRRWYFSGADIDAMIAAGGYMELTKQKVVNRVLDRLDE